MEIRYSTNPDSLTGFDTDELRGQYLVENVFGTDQVTTVYSHDDRMVIGGIRPTAGRPVSLETADPLRSEFFLQRRELGIVNVGTGGGTVTVDGDEHVLAPKEVLYVGRGCRDIVFAGSADAAFYLVSTPAHAVYPTVKGTLADATPVNLGSQKTSNERTINKFIHADGIGSCQLVLGITELAPGSMWNTMPAHTHERRTEVYLYFDLDDEERVVHLMGQPLQTRHLLVANEQAVISPAWSIHCGFGTTSYSFVWAMAGENIDYTDVEQFSISELR